MADNFIGEIRPFGFNFAPRGWALCAGQILPISQNTALFSLLGTMYGGDGRTTFALPNLMGRVPVGQGQGPGLSPIEMGEAFGQEFVTLLSSEIPNHGHTVVAGDSAATSVNPAGKYPAISTRPIYANGSKTPLASLAPTGQGTGHNNMQPFLAINYCIALTGIFPPRS